MGGAVLLKQASIFEEVSHKTFVLEVRIFSFRGRLVQIQNARFGAPDSQFSGASRIKRSFWKSGSSIFKEVSHKITKRSFWKSGACVFEETLVLELRILSFRGRLA